MSNNYLTEIIQIYHYFNTSMLLEKGYYFIIYELSPYKKIKPILIDGYRNAVKNAVNTKTDPVRENSIQRYLMEFMVLTTLR